jgi:hypothetical protein
MRIVLRLIVLCGKENPARGTAFPPRALQKPVKRQSAAFASWRRAFQPAKKFPKGRDSDCKSFYRIIKRFTTTGGRGAILIAQDLKIQRA